MADTIEQLVVRWTDAEEIRLRAGEIDTETMRTVLAVTRGFAAQVLEWNDDRMLNDIGGGDRATVLRDVPTIAGVRHDVLRALARRRRALDVLDEDLTVLETRFEAEAAAALVRDYQFFLDKP